jgi:hypothetical protein
MENHPAWANVNMMFNDEHIRIMQKTCQRDFRGRSLKILEQRLEDGPQ